MKWLLGTLTKISVVAALAISCAGAASPDDAKGSGGNQNGATGGSGVTGGIPEPGEGGAPPSLGHEEDYAIEYHHLRIEFLDQGDWATLAWDEADEVIKAKLVEQVGTANVLTIDKSQIGLNTNLGSDLAVTVDLAVVKDALEEPFSFHLTKGAAGTVTIRIYAIFGEEKVLLQEFLEEPAAKDFEVPLDAFEGKTPVKAPLAPTGKRGIALYYPWYSLESWSSEDLMDKPATPYASDNPEDLARQMDQAKSAGITAFVVSFTGPGTSSDENIAKLLDVAKDKDFFIGFFLETTIDGLTNNPDAIAARLTYIDETYGDHPALLAVDGRAVVVPWLTLDTTLENWKSAREKTRANGADVWFVQDCQDMDYLEVFDGVWYDGAIGGLGEKVRYFSVLADDPKPKLWIPTAMPGFDEHLLDDRIPPRVYPRENGAVFKKALADAVASSPHFVSIYTWNEWWENTYIEPSESYGDEYLRLTEDYLSPWLAAK